MSQGAFMRRKDRERNHEPAVHLSQRACKFAMMTAKSGHLHAGCDDAATDEKQRVACGFVSDLLNDGRFLLVMAQTEFCC
jgi:hypothetical protein